jgi:hypothetical protein
MSNASASSQFPPLDVLSTQRTSSYGVLFSSYLRTAINSSGVSNMWQRTGREPARLAIRVTAVIPAPLLTPDYDLPIRSGWQFGEVWVVALVERKPARLSVRVAAVSAAPLLVHKSFVDPSGWRWLTGIHLEATARPQLVDRLKKGGRCTYGCAEFGLHL